MKRVLTFVLFCMTMVLTFALCACTGSPSEPGDTSPETSEKATAVATEAPTETPTEAPTEAPTETPTEAPTEPETEPETEPYTPILRFAVASDTHIVGTTTTEAKRLLKLFEASFRYAEGHELYRGMDAFVFAGDVTNTGAVTDYQALNTLIEQGTAGKDTRVILTMGNHEWFGGDSARFVEMTGQELNQDIVIKGFHFIGMAPVPGDAYEASTLSWLSAAVKAADKEDPSKPIFTFQHHHIQDTVYVSHDWHTANSSQIKGIFNRYSQVINFSGHSHGPINTPTSIWQGKFTALGTGTLSYFEMEPGMTDGAFPPGYQDAAQFYIVEVDANNHVRILPYNILTDDFFRTPSNCDGEGEQLVYDIVTPSDPDTFQYGTARQKNAEAPYFDEGAEVEILAVDTNTVKLQVPVAYDKQMLYSYDMVFETEDGTKVEYKAFYDFYREPMPAEMIYTASGLKDSTTYTLTVYPVNCFGNRGETGITATLTTKEVERFDYVSKHPVNYVGTFTNFDAMTELTRSHNTYAYGGTVGGDIFGGDWQSNASSNAAQFALSEDRGYQGSRALDVWATNADNRGLYIFATEENQFTTQFPANDYLRVWVDFSDVEFRKMNFGFVSKNGGLYTTDEGDNRSDQAFYYLPEGETEWKSFVHGNDGCFGEAQATPVKGYKGWLAFPVKDFLYRSSTGSDGAPQGTPFTAYEMTGIYVFWDYADSASYVNRHFYLDEIQIVEDYKVFEAYVAP